jgi:hypothetical protein
MTIKRLCFWRTAKQRKPPPANLYPALMYGWENRLSGYPLRFRMTQPSPLYDYTSLSL